MSKEIVYCKGINIWDSPVFEDTPMSQENICPTLTSRPHGAVILGYMSEESGLHQPNAVYSPNGISPTLLCGHGDVVVKIVEKK